MGGGDQTGGYFGVVGVVNLGAVMMLIEIRELEGTVELQEGREQHGRADVIRCLCKRQETD